MDSAKKLENAEEGGEPVTVIFKAGDDVRQDCLTLQLIRMMDEMWRDEGLELAMEPYRCVATSPMTGILEVVKNSVTTADVHKRVGILGAFRDPSLSDSVLGGIDTPEFRTFIDTCCTAYSIVRKHMHLLVSLLLLMVPADMPELRGRDDINHLVTMIGPELTDDQAKASFTDAIYYCLDNKFKRFDNTIHILAHLDGDLKDKDGFLPIKDMIGQSNVWNEPDLLAIRAEAGDTMANAIILASSVKAVAGLQHPRVISLIGIAWEKATDIQVIFEYAESGDLRSLLDRNEAATLQWFEFKCQVAIDITDALAYLHNVTPRMPIAHLTSRKVLLTSRGDARVNFLSAGDAITDSKLRWTAPEIIRGEAATDRSDVYSLGVLLCELDTTQVPFHDAINPNGAKVEDALISRHVANGTLIPMVSEECLEPPPRGACATVPIL